jgi:hypothetical protein
MSPCKITPQKRSGAVGESTSKKTQADPGSEAIQSSNSRAEGQGFRLKPGRGRSPRLTCARAEADHGKGHRDQQRGKYRRLQIRTSDSPSSSRAKQSTSRYSFSLADSSTVLASH